MLSTNNVFYDFYIIEITTIEGVIDRAVTGLKQDQDIRAKEYPEIATQIEEFIGKLSKLKNLETPFTMVYVINACFFCLAF